MAVGRVLGRHTLPFSRELREHNVPSDEECLLLKYCWRREGG